MRSRYAEMKITELKCRSTTFYRRFLGKSFFKIDIIGHESHWNELNLRNLRCSWTWNWCLLFSYIHRNYWPKSDELAGLWHHSAKQFSTSGTEHVPCTVRSYSEKVRLHICRGGSICANGSCWSAWQNSWRNDETIVSIWSRVFQEEHLGRGDW